MAEAGVRVVIGDVLRDLSEATAKEIVAAAGGTAVSVPLDVTNDWPANGPSQSIGGCTLTNAKCATAASAQEVQSKIADDLRDN
jgi:hypothetical protein